MTKIDYYTNKTIPPNKFLCIGRYRISITLCIHHSSSDTSTVDLSIDDATYNMVITSNKKKLYNVFIFYRFTIIFMKLFSMIVIAIEQVAQNGLTHGCQWLEMSILPTVYQRIIRQQRLINLFKSPDFHLQSQTHPRVTQQLFYNPNNAAHTLPIVYQIRFTLYISSKHWLNSCGA